MVAKDFFCFCFSGLLLQESERFSEALHYYKMAIGSRPTLACKLHLHFILTLTMSLNLIMFRSDFQSCSCLPEHGNHPDEPGKPGRGQAHLPDLRRHP